jgi:malonate decarboxylase gamma subunit
VIGLVYDQALSGGFITSGLMADACYALPDATIRVMGLPAMARITKVPEELLTELAQSNPVFAPGRRTICAWAGWNRSGMAIWRRICAAALAQRGDQRSALGLQRGGRWRSR